MSATGESDNTVKSFITSTSSIKAIFLASVGGISALVSFCFALSTAKKNDNTKYDSETIKLQAAGSRLAIKALKWGSFYAVTSCSLISFGVWKLSGARNKEEFRMKMGTLFPKIPKHNPPQGRTEFSSLSDLMQYLDDEFSTKPDTKTNIISENSSLQS